MDGQHLKAGSERPPINEDRLQLYNMRFCPWAERTVLVLLAKKLEFDNVNVDLKKKPDWFLSSSLGKVPVLVHKGKFIPESLITSDYLDEVYPEPRLSSADPLQKALDRVLVEKVSSAMQYLYPLYIQIPGKAETDEEKLEMFSNLVKNISVVDEELKQRGTKFLFGESPGMVDYMIWPFFERIVSLPEALPTLGEKVAIPPNLSHLSAWNGAMWETEPVQSYAFRPKRLAKIHKIYQESNFDYDRALKESD